MLCVSVDFKSLSVVINDKLAPESKIGSNLSRSGTVLAMQYQEQGPPPFTNRALSACASSTKADSLSSKYLLCIISAREALS